MDVVAHSIQGGARPRRIAIGYLLSGTVLAASVLMSAPWWWLLWIAAILGESSSVFSADARPDPTQRQLDEVRRDWRKSFALFKPASSEPKANERMFELAGGSPQMARSAFAIGWMVPASALVVVAAGLKLQCGRVIARHDVRA